MHDSSRRRCLQALASAAGLAALARPLTLVADEAPAAYHFDISLAQWSLNKELFNQSLDPLDFPAVARTNFDIGAVEYVNQFFMDKAQDGQFLRQLRQRARDHDVKSLLIMIDGEGDLSAHREPPRRKAVQNHHKWIAAAAELECRSVRVNLHGGGSHAQWHQASVNSLRELCDFARDFDIQVLVENHGSYSSHGAWLAAVLKEVDDPLCGSMPDFGNFCYQREDGGLWDSPCVKHYDPYQGVADLMPFAGAVSAKAFDFDARGEETGIDFLAMMTLVKAAGYRGYVGIEYEGSRLSADEGIRATKALLERVRAQLA